MNKGRRKEAERDGRGDARLQTVRRALSLPLRRGSPGACGAQEGLGVTSSAAACLLAACRDLRGWGAGNMGWEAGSRNQAGFRPLTSARTAAPLDSVGPHFPSAPQTRQHLLRKPCQLPRGKAPASGKRRSETANPTITDKMDSSLRQGAGDTEPVITKA